MKQFNFARWIASVLLLAAAETSFAQASEWYLFAREEGCIPTSTVVRFEKLPRAPVSPDDFAEMLRARGESAVVEPISVVPQWAGHALQVRYRRDKILVFVKAEICSGIEK